MKRPNLLLLVAFLLAGNLVFATEYHVSKKGLDTGKGSIIAPFLTISRASLSAFPGDTITVHAGTYREWVNPIRGGESDINRIVYRAAEGEKVELKGSEIITGWKKEKESVWKITIPNSFFGNYNPYQDTISGDWFNRMGRIHHTGELFLNGKSFYEKETLAKVYSSTAIIHVQDSIGSTFTWYTESNLATTTIWANFHKIDPNKELTEISTRRTIFYPEQPGINYITISGFHFSQAATQWAAPTAEQVGMISTHWNKGWIIENNVISDSKCNGITLGKERGSGHNVWTLDKENVNRDGNIHYIEVLFNVLRKGWNKENIGSHLVRNNTIFNCEQTGICGSMGAAFSTIANNHIYNIWAKRQFNGAEIGGIKFHAAVDTYLTGNRIHGCGRGLWLDWMAQGTRVSDNLFYNNDLEDLFLEVNHGPFVVDNNLFLSPAAIRTQSEGGAYVHNLIAGGFYMWPDLNRFTPYFLPHSTAIAALTTILSGDDRLYNNIFVGSGKTPASNKKFRYGSKIYDNAKLPVWINGNSYCNGAEPSLKETNFVNDSLFNPEVKIVEEHASVYLHLSFNQLLTQQKNQLISTTVLGKAKIPKAFFDQPDGNPLIIGKDYFGIPRTEENNPAGPFVHITTGPMVLKVW